MYFSFFEPNDTSNTFHYFFPFNKENTAQFSLFLDFVTMFPNRLTKRQFARSNQNSNFIYIIDKPLRIFLFYHDNKSEKTVQYLLKIKVQKKKQKQTNKKGIIDSYF